VSPEISVSNLPLKYSGFMETQAYASVMVSHLSHSLQMYMIRFQMGPTNNKLETGFIH